MIYAYNPRYVAHVDEEAVEVYYRLVNRRARPSDPFHIGRTGQRVPGPFPSDGIDNLSLYFLLNVVMKYRRLPHHMEIAVIEDLYKGRVYFIPHLAEAPIGERWASPPYITFGARWTNAMPHWDTPGRRYNQEKSGWTLNRWMMEMSDILTSGLILMRDEWLSHIGMCWDTYAAKHRDERLDYYPDKRYRWKAYPTQSRYNTLEYGWISRNDAAALFD